MIGLPLWLIYVSVAFLVIILGKKFFNGRTCHLAPDLAGKVVIVTGSNCGIGYQTALEIAKLGASVVMACRDQKKAEEAIAELKKEVREAKIEFLKLDLADTKSIKEFVDVFKSTHDRLDILINNAGVSMEKRYETRDGFEMTFGVNHLGHFMLTLLLKDYLLKTPKSRVINVSSAMSLFGKIHWDDLMAEKSFGMTAYNQSKLANVIFSYEFNKRYESKGVKAVSLHPGAVRTEVTRNLKKRTLMNLGLLLMSPIILWTFKNSWQGAQTTLYCALLDFEELKGGEYYDNLAVSKMNKDGRNAEYGKRLWQKSLELLKMKDE